MREPRFAVSVAALAIVGLNASTALPQDFPSKPIRILTGGTGGGNDFAARIIAQGLTVNFKQQVIVDNRATALIAAETVAKAPPDGYMLDVAANSLWIAPLLQQMNYDPMRDLAPITLATSSPHILAVHPSLPAKSVRELIALAKARPGQLNYAAGATGGSPHLAAELFKSRTGVNIVGIPYKGAGPALTDLISGQVQLMFTTAGGVLPHVKSGRLRALAVTSAQPSVLVPGLPTMSASGVPGYEAVGLLGLLAPAKTPGAVINRLNQEIVRVLDRTDVKERFLTSGVETVGSSPEQFAATIKSDVTVWGQVIKDAGIRAD